MSRFAPLESVKQFIWRSTLSKTTKGLSTAKSNEGGKKAKALFVAEPNPLFQRPLGTWPSRAARGILRSRACSKAPSGATNFYLFIL